jgi:hypothetical protein
VAESSRVRCPAKGCTKRPRVTTAGNLYAHSRYSREFSGEFDTRCPASGENPGTWKEPETTPGVDEPSKLG